MNFVSLNMKHIFQFLAIILLFTNCQSLDNASTDLLNNANPELKDGWINMVVEIPSGSIEKWEVNKQTGQIEPDSLEGKPRIIKYLGYPGNYGFIPQTLLPKEQGGDGDPLDVLAIGEAVKRGSILRCKIVGVLKLKDTGEQDDKLIAIAENSPLKTINSLAELRTNYPGILKIIETWFTNYKGKGRMVSEGYAGVEVASKIIQASINAFK